MPQVYLEGYGDSSINFAIHYWIGMTEQTDSHRIRCDLLQVIDRATEKATAHPTSILKPERSNVASL